MIERESIDKRTGAQSGEIAPGITSRRPQEASRQRVLGWLQAQPGGNIEKFDKVEKVSKAGGQ